MRDTIHTERVLNELGFTRDFSRTKNPQDIDWFSLSNGWGFRLDAYRNFEELILAMLKYEEEDDG